MHDTAARLLDLLTVLQTRPEWSADELAERLAVTSRTVRRDVDRLRRLGYVIDSRPGAHGGYRLGRGRGVPPLLFDADEAVAVAVALRSTAATGIAGVEDAAVTALVKLEQSLPSELRRRMALLPQAVVPLTGPGPAVAVEVLVLVATSVRDRRQLRADYLARSGATSTRLLEPHRVVHVRGLWYLVAWDVDRGDWRTFRLDRMVPHDAPGRRFAPRPLPTEDVAAHVAAGITAHPYPHRCRLTVMAPAEVVGERVGPTQGRVRALTPSTCEVVGGSVSLEEMAAWVARLGVDVVVHEPPELREHLVALSERLARAATASGAAAQGEAPGSADPPSRAG